MGLSKKRELKVAVVNWYFNKKCHVINVKIKLFSDSNLSLNVRVKERENGGTRKGSVGSIFKDAPTTAIKSLFRRDSTHDLKDTIKRPLTGTLFVLLFLI